MMFLGPNSFMYFKGNDIKLQKLKTNKKNVTRDIMETTKASFIFLLFLNHDVHAINITR